MALRQIVREAMRAHRQGNVEDAENLYRRAIALDPNDAVAVHYFGLLLLDRGFNNEALSRIAHSIFLDPDKPEFRLNEASAFFRSGRYNEAAQSFRECISRNPGNSAAQLGLAQTLSRLELFEEALPHFDLAITRRDLGTAPYLGKAIALRALKRFDDALGVLDRTPTSTESDFMRATLLMDVKRPDLAASVLAGICDREPGNRNALIRLAIALEQSKRFSEALSTYDRLVTLNPVDADALRGRAKTLAAVGKPTEAVQNARDSVSLQPDNADNLIVLGLCLMKARNFNEATECFDDALRLRPNAYAAERYSVCSLLHAGRFAEAWKRAETRHKWQDAMPAEYVRETATAGEWPILEKTDRDDTVLVIGEHGLGDEIMFGSLIPEFSQIQPKLIVQLDDRLVPMFSRSLPNIKFIGHEMPQPEHDKRARLASLPVILRNDLSEFKPTSGGFLRANPDRTRTLGLTLRRPARKLCGLSWKTINPFDDGLRSLEPAMLCSTLRMDGWNFVNLQYATNDHETEILREYLGGSLIETDIDLFYDIDGVASLIANCDVVVTAGNSIAHMAGALGRKTLTLVPYSPSWRWFGESSESLWYSSVELIRQRQPGDWTASLDNARLQMSLLTKGFS